MSDQNIGEKRSLPKLLVVDDDEQILRQIRWALSEDYEVFTAIDRPSALDLFQKENISVVLLDLGLPPHPREATEGLRALDELIALDSLVKVIIVSGNSERPNALRAIEKGAHDIFPKPVDLDELKVVKANEIAKKYFPKENLQFVIIGKASDIKEVVKKYGEITEKEISADGF